MREFRETLNNIFNAVDRLAAKHGPDSFATVIIGSLTDTLTLMARHNSGTVNGTSVLATFWVAPNEPDTHRYLQLLATCANEYRDELSTKAQLEAERPTRTLLVKASGRRGDFKEHVQIPVDIDDAAEIHRLVCLEMFRRYPNDDITVRTHYPVDVPNENIPAARPVSSSAPYAFADRQRWIGLANGEIAAKKPYVVARATDDDLLHWIFNTDQEIEFDTRDQAGQAAGTYSREGATYGIFRATDTKFMHAVGLASWGILYVSISEQ